MLSHYINKTLVVLFVVVTFFSCKKDDNNSANNTTDAAQQLYSLDVTYGADAAQKLDLYLPANRTDTGTKILVLIHGGSWVAGDKGDFNTFILQLRSALPTYAIANFNYRLGVPPSTNLWPTQYTDIKAAFDFLNTKASYYHYNTSKTAVYGESAGSQLAMLKAYKDNGDGKIKTVINVFGPNDMADLYNYQPANNQTLLQLFLGGTPTTNATAYANASPINFVSASSPATISFHGTVDALVPYQQSVKLDSLLKTKSVTSSLTLYAGEGHGQFNATNTADAFTKSMAFLQANNK